MGFSAETRRAILTRDGGCVVAHLLSGDCEGTLHCHHILPAWSHPELADDPRNGAAVCQRHHPMWESIRRVLARKRHRACPHRHRSSEARRLCEQKLNRAA